MCAVPERERCVVPVVGSCAINRNGLYRQPYTFRLSSKFCQLLVFKQDEHSEKDQASTHQTHCAQHIFLFFLFRKNVDRVKRARDFSFIDVLANEWWKPRADRIEVEREKTKLKMNKTKSTRSRTTNRIAKV